MISLSGARSRVTIIVLGWLLSAGVAVLVGLGAIDALGSGIVGPASPPLSAGDVQRQLATLSASPTPTPTATTAPLATTHSAPATSEPTQGGATSGTAQTSGPSGSDGGGDGAGSDNGSSAPPPPADLDPPPSSSPPPADDGITEVTSTDGGTVISTCRSGLATIDSASPLQGFVKENLERGPDKEVGVRFESDSLRVEVSITCAADGPVVDVDTDHED